MGANFQKWNDGRRGQDGWDRYTRRRKWCRDAELVEIPLGSESSSAEATSGLTQALDQQKQKESGALDASTADADSQSLAPSASSKTRRRRWFGSSKSVSDKANSISSAATASNNNSSVDLGRITSAPSSSLGKSASRPISIPVRKLSNYSRSSSGSHGLDGSAQGSNTPSESTSLREKEIAHAQDHLDRWGARAAGGTERAEREMGLGDEVNMGLS